MTGSIKKLLDGAAQMNVSLPDKFGEQMELFLSELLRWNEFMNLTAITDLNDMITKHVLDSLSVLSTGLFINKISFIDVGCGAGFPSIPVKLARPDLTATLLDGVNKKLNFLRETGDKLGLRGISYVHGRAEELARGKVHRGNYDIAVARAVAALPALCEYCLPLVKTGGHFLAMKGPAVDEELEAAARAIVLLGGKVKEKKEISIPFTDLTHNLIIIEKITATPEKYPRQSAKISSSPL